MRYITMTAERGGWTDWVQPHHEMYKLRCCDCECVHDLQFRVVEDDPDDPQVDHERVIPGLVVFRARRNERATAACRRKKAR